MKKNLKFALFALWTFVVLFSCQDDQIGDLVKDSRFKTKILNTGNTDFENLYMNTATDFAVEIKRAELGNENYRFDFSQIAGTGVLYYRDSILKVGESIACNEDRLELRYIPTSQGDHRLKLNFTNDALSVSEGFIGKANRLEFHAMAENLPSRPLIGKQFSFDLKLEKANLDNAGGQKFMTRATVLDGVGEVIIPSNADDDSTKLQTKTTSDSIPTKSVSNKNTFYLTSGKNKISYIGNQAGRNVIQFNVENEYGYAQVLEVPIEIVNPDFTVKAVIDTTAYAGTTNNFLLVVEDTDNHGANNYSLSYRNIKNRGNLKVNNNELQVGSSLVLQKGQNICEFIPEVLGDAELEFIVKDKFNTVKKDTAIFKVIKSIVEIKVSNYDSIASIADANSFNFAISKKDYKGKYRFEITQNPVNSTTLKINGAVYAGGRIEVTNKDNTLVTLIPAKPGNTKLTIKVTDDFGSETEKELDFSVKNTTGKIIVSNHNPAIKLLSPTNFNFAVQKGNYNGGYKFEIVSEPVTVGTLKVNGTVYTGGKINLENQNNTLVTFTPSLIKDVKLTIQVYDAYDGIITESLLFSVSNTNIEILVKEIQKDLILGKESHFKFTPRKVFYEGELNYKLSLEPADAGTLKVNGQSYIAGIGDGNLFGNKVTNNAEVNVSFTPAKEGPANLTVKVYDDFSGEARQIIPFSVTNPSIRITPSNFISSTTLNVENVFNFAVEKPNYTGKFQYSITTNPQSSGKIKVNDTDYPGGRIDLTNLTNSKIGFIPAKEGTVTLSLTVYDELGGSITREFEYKVTNNPIKLLVSNQETGLTIDKATNFNFAVSKEQYSGKFLFEITSEPVNSGSIKINGAAYAGGKTEVTNPANTKVTFTPSRTGEVKLFLKAYDSFDGQEEEELSFSVQNSDLQVVLSNLEKTIQLNKVTTFNFAVIKQNYSGTYKYEITTSPENCGDIKVNGNAYTGGKVSLGNPQNSVVEFISKKAGQNSLFIKIHDEQNGSGSETVIYDAVNPPITLAITGHEPDLTVNKKTSFNVAMSKQYYTGNFKYQITQSPVNSGTLEVNGSAYSGAIATVTDPDNLRISYVPNKIGNSNLILKITDEFEGETSEIISFVSTNPPIELRTTNKETNLVLNKETSLNLAISKAHYTGRFKYQITQIPANSGTLKVNGTVYTGAITSVPDPDNVRISFLPTIAGTATLKLKVTDEIEGEKEDLLIFNVVDPPVIVTVNNPNAALSVGETGNFSLKAAKADYTGDLKYEITPVPYDAGKITVAGSEALQGSLKNDLAVNVAFTPAKLGTSVLNIKATDANGKASEKQVVFSSNNTPVEITFPNYAAGCILNQPTEFVLKVTKDNYADSKKITYSVTPATTSGPIMVNNTAYNGTDIEVPYGTIKKGIPVKFTPSKEGECTLTFSATDEFGTNVSKSIKFNVANPDLTLFLSGINTGTANEASLGETYKFTYNIDKEYYSDDFAYYITTVPANAGITATSDVTPRSARSGNGVLTGTIASSNFGVSTGEIRFTPNNSNLINQNVTINVEVRDKWNNKKSTTGTFTIRTSAINVNIDRRTSIPVETPYQFYFTANKPGYSGIFKYTFIGWNDGDKLEISGDAATWTPYHGGKFDMPSADHTYVRYTPAKIGTAPLKLFIYDNNGSEAMAECTFDVRAPYVTLSGGGTKSVYVEEFANYAIGASDEKGNPLTASFDVDPNLVGQVKFNDAIITSTSTRSVTPRSNIAVGNNNKLEIMSKLTNTVSVSMTASNKWGGAATVTTITSVSEIPEYTLTTSTAGQGTVKGDGKYKAGTTATITATPTAGWIFVRWEGDITGSSNPATIVMNSDKTVTAVFEADPRYTLTVNVIGNGTVTKTPDQAEYKSGANVKLTAVPDRGFTLLEWRGDASGTGEANVIMNSNKSVIAEFRRQGNQQKNVILTAQSAQINSGQLDVSLGLNQENVTVSAINLANIILKVEFYDNKDRFISQATGRLEVNGSDCHALFDISGLPLEAAKYIDVSIESKGSANFDVVGPWGDVPNKLGQIPF